MNVQKAMQILQRDGTTREELQENLLIRWNTQPECEFLGKTRNQWMDTMRNGIDGDDVPANKIFEDLEKAYALLECSAPPHIAIEVDEHLAALHRINARKLARILIPDTNQSKGEAR